MDFCEPVPCHDPINLLPGSAFVSGKEPRDPRFGTKVTAMCPTGLKNANGSRNLYCDSDGKWRWTSGHLSCGRQTCSDPHNIRNGDGPKNVTRGCFKYPRTFCLSAWRGTSWLAKLQSPAERTVDGATQVLSVSERKKSAPVSLALSLPHYFCLGRLMTG